MTPGASKRTTTSWTFSFSSRGCLCPTGHGPSCHGWEEEPRSIIGQTGGVRSAG